MITCFLLVSFAVILAMVFPRLIVWTLAIYAGFVALGLLIWYARRAKGRLPPAPNRWWIRAKFAAGVFLAAAVGYLAARYNLHRHPGDRPAGY